MARGVRVDTVRALLAGAGEILEAVPRVTADGAIAFEFTLAATPDEATLAAWRADGVAVERLAEANPSASEPAAVEAAADADVPAAAPLAPSHFVRVDLARLDELMRNVGDLVISRAQLGDTLARVEAAIPAGEWRAIQENGIAIDRQLRTLREGIMRVRLVPVGEIFRRMPFVVRDLARETGKRVRMELQGQSTEIDKFLVERMMDPVLHLVRNAVSHGIETVEERVAAGKRPEGTIVLSAATAGDIVRIDIADDGRGVDPEVVFARARAAGLPVPAGTPDAATLLSLLCAPGFSTRDASDRTSGRGVGMSVVAAAVEQLSGTLRLETEMGTGTRFVIELPVTLAITDALVARVGVETFAVPQGSIREVIAVPQSALVQVERNEMTPHRGSALPIVRLSRLFGLADSAGDRLHVLVVGTGAAALGIAVDRIVGQREIVVRAIGDTLARVDGISGATDLGDGRVVLILDPAVLARQTRERPDRGVATTGRASA
jgi:two-component system chemotaxis sensor kinase CheA